MERKISNWRGDIGAEDQLDQLVERKISNWRGRNWSRRSVRSANGAEDQLVERKIS